mmetsp:Transcript_23916/g.72008  ORF Transcript_23916/g.72008 Transcript_23916/m.72008 type:complete len:236 (+) Transcript_23916:952-1659(+)
MLSKTGRVDDVGRDGCYEGRDRDGAAQPVDSCASVVDFRTGGDAHDHGIQVGVALRLVERDELRREQGRRVVVLGEADRDRGRHVVVVHELVLRHDERVRIEVHAVLQEAVAPVLEENGGLHRRVHVPVAVLDSDRDDGREIRRADAEVVEGEVALDSRSRERRLAVADHREVRQILEAAVGLLLSLSRGRRPVLRCAGQSGPRGRFCERSDSAADAARPDRSHAEHGKGESPGG